MQKIKAAGLILIILLFLITVSPHTILAHHLSNWPTIPTKPVFLFPRQDTSSTPPKQQTPTPLPTSVQALPTSVQATKTQIKPTDTPSPTQAQVTADSKKTFIMDTINGYRTSKNLPKVSIDPYTCGFAKLRAKEISANFSHDGFKNRINNKTLPYPSYRLITENIALNSDYKKVASAWINSSGHRENMEKDTPYVCVESFGDYYAHEGWKP